MGFPAELRCLQYRNVASHVPVIAATSGSESGRLAAIVESTMPKRDHW